MMIYNDELFEDARAVFGEYSQSVLFRALRGVMADVSTAAGFLDHFPRMDPSVDNHEQVIRVFQAVERIGRSHGVLRPEPQLLLLRLLYSMIRLQADRFRQIEGDLGPDPSRW